MEEIARAKINLALHVLGRRPDGYHALDTIFAFAEAGDVLRARSAETLSLRIEGPFAAGLEGGERNLVLRAARALQAEFGVEAGAALILDKRLPVAAGLGGGSADAAAALRLLVRLWDLDAGNERLAPLAARLGADVPACLLSRTVRGTGKGDALQPVDLALAGTPLLLVNPGVPLSTRAVFERWKPPGSGPLPPDPGAGGNDLEPPAVALVPEVGDLLGALRRCAGATVVRMSGSGATCFAFFEDERSRDEAAASFAAQRPAWWCLSSRLI